MLDVPPPPNGFYLWTEIARNLALGLAGFIGLGIAWWRSRAANIQARAALEQNELARRDHITELFIRAVGQLGDDKLEVRLGAIFTLLAICDDRKYQPYTGPVIQTLSAYVRGKGLDDAGDGMSEDVKVIANWLHSKTSRS